MIQHLKRKEGFTLIELLLVVIVLGILAALAIPQFTDASKDARESTLKGDLATIRGAIERYYHEHNSTYPGAVEHTTGSGAPADPEASFVAQLTLYSDKNGKTSPTLDRANYPYGPYLRDRIPENQLAESTASAAKDGVNVTTSASAISADANPTKGWKYSSVTGQFIANSSGYDTW
ncbi:MAG: prepilin-type N-terminal cleavage/methylation domain-containing protein [Candidatus Schekmanbacteria bacterium]|nr:MAG: prepilin-type N-terminal cleavage/methylation domain-containing protein [Candidatus Schekmanbacteria bacterium]